MIMFEFGGRWTAICSPQALRKRSEVPAANQKFRQPRHPEELDVPASPLLLRIRIHELAPNGGMRRVGDGETVKAFRPRRCDPPSNPPAPIVTDNRKAARAPTIGKAENVGCELIEIIGRDVLRFFAQIVTALVRCDDVKTCRCERQDVVFPGSPVFREAMEQEQQRAVVRASLGEMQRYSVDPHIGETKLAHGDGSKADNRTGLSRLCP